MSPTIEGTSNTFPWHLYAMLWIVGPTLIGVGVFGLWVIWRAQRAAEKREREGR